MVKYVENIRGNAINVLGNQLEDGDTIQITDEQAKEQEIKNLIAHKYISISA